MKSIVHSTIVTFLALTFCFVNFTANAQTFAWAKQYNQPNGPFVGKTGGLDAAGNYYVTGKDFIIKHSSSGAMIWVKQFANFSSNAINAIAVDASGNIFIAGNFTGTYDFDPGPGVNNIASSGYTDGFVEKFDASGNFIWAGAIGGPGMDRCNSLCLDGLGNICLTGNYGYMGANTSYADFDPGVGQYLLTSNGHYDRFIEKLDGNGNFLWVNSAGGPQADAGGQITTDANNDIFLVSLISATNILDKFDPNGNTLWSKELFTGPSIVDITIDNGGNLVSTGTFSGTYDFDPGPAVYNLTAPDLQDFFIWKLDNAGNFVWAKRVIGGGTQASSSVATDVSGNVYTTGFHSGTGNHDFDPGPGIYNISGSGMFVQKLDAAGNFAWAVSFAGTGSATAFGYSLQVSSANDVYTSARISGSVDFNPGKAKYNLNSSAGTFVVNKMTQGAARSVEDETEQDDIIVEKNISVYPNPNNGYFSITVPGTGKNGVLTIYDAAGKTIERNKINIGDNRRIQPQMNRVRSGIYFIEIRVDEDVFYSQVVIQ